MLRAPNRIVDRGRSVDGKSELFGDGGRKRVLVVLFTPSVARDGVSPVEQDHWVEMALETLG